MLRVPHRLRERAWMLENNESLESGQCPCSGARGKCSVRHPRLPPAEHSPAQKFVHSS